MSTPTRGEITRILRGVSERRVDPDQAVEFLYDHVYGELHKIAGGLMHRERIDHTLQPTALVHEAFLKMVDQTEVEWESRAHFYGIAARAMRQVLVDHARRHNADKRGGDMCRVTIDENLAGAQQVGLEILALHAALEKLQEEDPRMARGVELRVFSGLLSREVAEVLGVSKRTVDEDWKIAQMWLGRELAEKESP